MKVLFFDIHLIMINRYPKWLSARLNDSMDNIRFYYVYEEDVKISKSKLLSELPSDSTIIKVKKPTKKHIESIYDEINPTILFTSGQRFPDAAFTIIARNRKIPVFMYQHGLYVEFMPRTPYFFISKLKKTVRFLMYLKIISNLLSIPYRKVFSEYFKVYITGTKMQAETSLPMSKINADLVFVIGDYWKEFHQKMYGYQTNQQINIGYPDLFKLNTIRRKKRFLNNGICYICQSLVEDGRLKREVMVSFLDRLVSFLPDSKLLIFKLHHKSDLSLYNKYLQKKNVQIVENKELLPFVPQYVGHYSSFLALPLFITKSVLLWEFDNHETPFYLSETTDYLTNNYTLLDEFCKSEKIHLFETVNHKLLPYFYFDGDCPEDKIVRYLKEHYLD